MVGLESWLVGWEQEFNCCPADTSGFVCFLQCNALVYSWIDLAYSSGLPWRWSKCWKLTMFPLINQDSFSWDCLRITGLRMMAHLEIAWWFCSRGRISWAPWNAHARRVSGTIAAVSTAATTVSTQSGTHCWTPYLTVVNGSRHLHVWRLRIERLRQSQTQQMRGFFTE